MRKTRYFMLVIVVFAFSFIFTGCEYLLNLPPSIEEEGILSFWAESDKQEADSERVLTALGSSLYVDLTCGEDEIPPLGFSTKVEAESKYNQCSFDLKILKNDKEDITITKAEDPSRKTILYPGDGYHALKRYHITNLQQGVTYEFEGSITDNGNLSDSHKIRVYVK